jgi:hypothetical protein
MTITICFQRDHEDWGIYTGAYNRYTFYVESKFDNEITRKDLEDKYAWRYCKGPWIISNE